jgi:hypothetical protein
VNWKPAEWCLLILSATIPLSLLGVLGIRVFTDRQASPEAGAMLADLLKVIGGGVIGIIGTLLSKDK